MDFLTPTSVSELIIDGLREGPRSTVELLRTIQGRRRVTKQGFYAALRELKKSETVLVYRHTVSLNAAWIARMQERLTAIGHAYLSSPVLPDLLALQEKESISFSFSSSRTLDSFWGHAQSLLLQHTPAAEPIYSYDPHYWFYLARKETEERLIRDIEASRRQFLMIVGGDGELDRLIQKRFASDALQYHRERLFDDPSYYVSAIGDYLIEVWLDPHLSEQVEKVFASSNPLQQGVASTLLPLLEKKSRNKIKISRNKSRAESLKKKFRPHFFITRAIPDPTDS